MANAIQIKRRSSSGPTGAPSASVLKWGELAFNEADNTLYYGYGSGNDQALSVPSIGGSGAYSLRGGTNATGVWPISIDGNAATVTNGVTYTGTPTAGYIPKFNDSDTIENGYQISTNLGTQNSDVYIPRADAVKTYIDSVKQGLDIKDSVRVATVNSGELQATFNDTLYTWTSNSNGMLTIDGILLVSGDRFLVKNSPNNNGFGYGIYQIVSSGNPSTPWSATIASDSASDRISAGAFTFVSEGTVNGDTGWVLTDNDPIDILSSQVWSQFSAAGQIYDGSGLYKQGNTISVGQGAGITVGANDVAVNAGSGLTADSNGVHIGVNGGLTLGDNSISVDSTVVRITGDQVISGIKEFTSVNNTNLNLSVNEVGGNSFINFRESGVNKVFIGFNGSDDSLNINSVALGFTSRLKINTLTHLIASGTSSTTSYIPVFIDEPSSTAATLCYKSSGDFVSDLGVLLSSDTSVVRTTGNQSIDGQKTFTSFITSPSLLLSGPSSSITFSNAEDIYIYSNQTDLQIVNSLADSGISLDATYTKLKAPNTSGGSVGYFAVFDSDPSSSVTQLKSVSKDSILDDIGAAASGLTITAGSGLVGGGTLSQDIVFDIGQGDGITVSDNTIAHANTSDLTGTQGSDGISSITLDGFGHVTAVTTAAYVTSASLCSSIASCPIDGGTF